MLISIANEGLILHDDAKGLRNNIKSQLKSWGFKEKDNYFVLDNYEYNTLSKVVGYFDRRKIDYDLDADAKKSIEEFNNTVQCYSEKMESLRRYKNGIIDNAAISDFKEFTSTLPRKLKSHQFNASLHLYMAESAANFSVPGSGKTTVVLSVYEKLKREGVVGALFVIGPLSCFGSWKDEFVQVLGRKPKTTILAGGNKEERIGNYFNYTNTSELYLTSFQTNMFDFEYTCKLLEQLKIFLVIDEAHYMKRPEGEWANAVLSIAPKAVRRVALTGTPMPKGYSDLFNLVQYLYPDYQYLDTKDKLLLKNFEEDNNVDEAKDLIERKVGPLFYRVRKEELHLEPQVFKDPIIITMGEYERLIYDAILSHIAEYADQDYLNNIDFVNKLIRGRMIRLRQCVSYTKLLSTAIEEYDEDLLGGRLDLSKVVNNYDEYESPSKLNKLLSMIDGFLDSKQKVIVWSNFIGTIELIEKALGKKGIYCKKIIGATPVEKETISVEETRESIRNEFNDSESHLYVLLANPAACAESISLHICCNNAIYYDLSYNCAQYLQSLDRIHRVGASEKVEAYYYTLQYSDTLDSDILENLSIKSERMQQIIDSDYAIQNMDMFDDNDEIAAYNRLFNNV